jgi:hypothetical protein
MGLTKSGPWSCDGQELGFVESRSGANILGILSFAVNSTMVRGEEERRPKGRQDEEDIGDHHRPAT